ncbi:hypothetical protein HTIA_0936 [Halorhabdus tiamatea SARL4B]|uniref:Uncharacterized protein n=1 Tax=Halorhabdus tiamatea SARL4B TaxID=1033806 RepID=S6D2B1_9EURY|nr:hypothetical protein HTIA_0936 [Halorhabdus tiamatea SARL4B]
MGLKGAAFSANPDDASTHWSAASARREQSERLGPLERRTE